MAHFCGVLKGARGLVTRMGSKKSGLVVTAAGWRGAICVALSHDEQEDADIFRVEQIPWNGAGCSRTLCIGRLGEWGNV